MTRRGSLTHMQFAQWLDDAMRRTEGRPPLVLYGRSHLPEHVSMHRIRDAVHALCQRHEALRTRYELDDQGRLSQVVRPAQPPDIVCRDTGSDDAVPDGAQRLIEEFRAAGFPLDTGPVIRVGVVTRAHRPREIVLVLHHIAGDAWSMRILLTELDALLRPTTEPAPPELPAPGVQPLDQADNEDSPTGRRQADRALAYLREQLQLIPPRLFPDPPADSPVALRANLAMSLDHSALTAVARRCGTTPSVVIAAAYNAVLSVHTGHARCPIILTSSNRHSPKVSNSVGAFFGTVPMSCDLSGDPPFSVVVARVRDAYLRALRHTNPPGDVMQEMRAHESFRRGVAVRTDISFGMRDDERSRAEMLAMAAVPRGEVVLGQSTPSVRIELSLEVGVDESSCLLTLQAATHLLDPARARQFLLTMQRLLTTAVSGAADPRPSDLHRLAGLTGPDRHGEWVQEDGTWVDITQTESVLNEHPAVDQAVVFGRADWPSEDGLVGCVATRDPGLTPYALRRYLVAASQANAAIMAPHRYVIRAEVPVPPREPSAWQAPGQLAYGDGLVAPDRPTRSPEEAALCRAVARSHGLPQVSPEACYLLLGGRLRRLPAVMAELERAGYHPPPYHRFTGWHTLGELALLLRPATAGSRTTAGS